MGGEGGTGGPEPTLCERACGAAESLNCSADAACETDYCLVAYGLGCDDQADTFYECAADAPSSDWMCDTSTGLPTYAGTPCQDELDALVACF
jgi:hypothetical protein